jgi:hypothetical protein
MALNIPANYLLHMIMVVWTCNLELGCSFLPFKIFYEQVWDNEG